MRVPKRVNWKREDDIFAKLLCKYNVERVDGSAVSPYCVRAEIPFSNDEDMVRNFANELFHELGVLDEDSDIDFGEMTDYCRLDKDNENNCYYIVFNHHKIVRLRPGDDGYEYSVAVEFGDSEDSGDEFGEWNDDDTNYGSDATIKRPSAKRRAEIEKLIVEVLSPYRIVPEVGEINPYCYNVRVNENMADEVSTVEAFNDVFHALGVLPEGEILDVGEESDYCEIYKTDDGYIVAPFNDPKIMAIGEADENYQYVLKVVRAGLKELEQNSEIDSGDMHNDVVNDVVWRQEEKHVMRIVTEGIKTGAIRSPTEEGNFILKCVDFVDVDINGAYDALFDFNLANLINSIGIKIVCFKKARTKEEMRFEVKSVGLLDADDRECDPYNIPDGFIATTIAIHLGRRIG